MECLGYLTPTSFQATDTEVSGLMRVTALKVSLGHYANRGCRRGVDGRCRELPVLRWLKNGHLDHSDGSG